MHTAHTLRGDRRTEILVTSLVSFWRSYWFFVLCCYQIETKYECSPFLEIFSGDSIVRPSNPEAQVVYQYTLKITF